MAEHSSVFDGLTYSSADFRNLLAGLLQSDGGTWPGTGLVYNPGYAAFLPVADGASGLTVKVQTASVGYAWLLGAAYRNDTSPDQALTIAANSSGLARLDAIVLCLNLSGAAYTGGATNPYTAGQSIPNASIGLAVRVGTPAGSPVAPSPVRTLTTPGGSGVYELVLGWVTVPNGAANISTVADKRGDTTLCPWATLAGAAVSALVVGSAALKGNVTLAGGGATTVTSAGNVVTITTPAAAAAVTSVNGQTGPAITIAGAGTASVAASGNTVTITGAAAPVSSVGGQTGAVAIAGASGTVVSATGGTVTIDPNPVRVAAYQTASTVTSSGSAYQIAWTITTTYAARAANDNILIFGTLRASASGYNAGDTLTLAGFLDGVQLAGPITFPVTTNNTVELPFQFTANLPNTANHTIDVRLAFNSGSPGQWNAQPLGRQSNATILGFR